MKRIRITAVTLALLFVGLSSFTKNKFTNSGFNSDGWFSSWFEYDNWGDPRNPESYSRLTETPGCDGDYTLCAVYVEMDFNGVYPSDFGLWQLGLLSASFTERYSGIYGNVRLSE